MARLQRERCAQRRQARGQLRREPSARWRTRSRSRRGLDTTRRRDRWGRSRATAAFDTWTARAALLPPRLRVICLRCPSCSAPPDRCHRSFLFQPLQSQVLYNLLAMTLRTSSFAQPLASPADDGHLPLVTCPRCGRFKERRRGGVVQQRERSVDQNHCPRGPKPPPKQPLRARGGNLPGFVYLRG